MRKQAHAGEYLKGNCGIFKGEPYFYIVWVLKLQ